jgi:WXXGXW repeat (2 copies)
MKKLRASIVLLISMLVFIAGCGPSAVVVSTRPEPPVYARPAYPGGGYVWVESEWIRRGHGYVYRQGYWAAPRQRYHAYVTGHWQQRRQGWYWVPGHWNR